MSAIIDQKAYLQKYLSGGASNKKKKKKVSKGKGFKIIDDDIDITKLRPLEGDEIDMLGQGEDAPQIAGIIDERPEDVRKMEQFSVTSKWRVINQDDGFNSNLEVEEIKKSVKQKQKENEIMFGKMYSDSEDEKDDSDASPPRRDTHSKEGKHKEVKAVRNRKDSNSSSPPRRNRKHSTSSSPPRRNPKHSSDCSPPRRNRKHSTSCSPPRRIRKHSSDCSPPRRNRKHSSDCSPPRRNRKHSSDCSPPRRNRKHSSDCSPPRRNRKHSSDCSPPRRKKTKASENKDSKSVSNAVGRSSRWSDAKGETDESVMAIIMGKSDKTEERRLEKEKKEKQMELNEKYKKWSKGLKQIEDQQERVQDYLHEASKPLARHKDDKDLENTLKDQERAGDPMLGYIRDKKRERGELPPERPLYKGSFPPNRFNISPGHRWDGVDRSNGYEKKYFDQLSKRKAQEEEVYKWSTADL